VTAETDRVRAASYAHLLAELDALRARLHGGPPDDAAVAKAAAELGGPSALDVLAAAFGLDDFERAVVLLCTGFEIDARFSSGGAAPTVGLALASLPNGTWTAFHETGVLRQWGIVDVADESPFTNAALRLSRDALGFVLGQGVPGDDDVVRAYEPPGDLPASQATAANAVTGAVRGLLAAGDPMPVVELRGAGAEERRAVAAAYAAALGTDLYVADVRDLPPPGAELVRVLRDWARRAVLADRCLLVETGDDGDPGDRDRVRAAVALVPGALVVSAATEAVGDVPRPVVRHAVPWPDAAERLAVWQAAYARAGGGPLTGDDLAALAGEYRLGPATVRAVCAEAAGAAGVPPLAAVREACRLRTRARLDPVADRVDVDGAPPLVLPAPVRAELDELVRHVADAPRLHREWGGAVAMPGIAAMFAGPSGTGKTLAAVDVARRTGLDLYRVDLSLLVSKWVGETEKNIRRVFDGADLGGALLLFDEADALFGKRTDAQDGHDRYANLEVAYLLQRVEQARTPVILTTNLADAVDPAFLRRLRFVVTFPFPDAEAREALWRNVFPAETPTTDLDPAKLARLTANGATIRDVALRATFAAAAEGEPVSMRHLREGAVREARKAGREISADEIGGWA
jgi:hypothetical protein